jgi:hypothetical protein
MTQILPLTSYLLKILEQSKITSMNVKYLISFPQDNDHEFAIIIEQQCGSTSH